MTGRRWVYDSVYNPITEHFDPVWAGGANRCRYDALGRRTNGCGGGLVLGFDGDNVIRAEQGGYGYASWRYVQGPGLDDPLVAVHPIGSSQDKYYYLTDGRGRHLAFTDSTGKNYMEPASVGGPEYSRYYQQGGNQAGSIEDSHGFDNTRGASDNAPQLSYYRNRYYDQQTGRFINEDPIGVAGGVNLYQYAGNSPSTFTDPFGLKVCGGDDALRTGVEKAVNATITWDQEGCVSDLTNVTFHDSDHWTSTQGTFAEMVTSNHTWRAVWGDPNEPTNVSPFGCPEGHCSNFDPDTRTAFIFHSDIGTARYHRCGFWGALGFEGTYTLGGLVSHELISHGRGLMSGRSSHSYFSFWTAENEYHTANDEPTACPKP